MARVGLPGGAQGWQKTDVTIDSVLKGQGYATGQFGKNHQGDRAFVLVPIQGLATEFLLTMRDYPPSQTPGSFNLSSIEAQLKQGMGDR